MSHIPFTRAWWLRMKATHGWVFDTEGAIRSIEVACQDYQRSYPV